MEGAENPFKELKEKFTSTFIRSCAFWLPAQSINFLFVLPKFRVIYVGTCAFVWVNILCWIKRMNFSDDNNNDYHHQSSYQKDNNKSNKNENKIQQNEKYQDNNIKK